MSKNWNILAEISKYKPTDSKDAVTNITYLHPVAKSSYYIPLNFYECFLKMISETIFTESQNVMCYNETGQEIKKFILDFDWNIGKQMITEKTIFEIAKSVKTILTRYYGGYTKEFNLYVLTKDSYANGKDGLHMIIPELKCSINTLYNIRKSLIYSLFNKEGAVFAEYKDLAETVVDKMVLNKTPWMIYGCSKTGNNPYLVRYSYNVESLEKTVHDPYDTKYVSMFKMLYISGETEFDSDFDKNSLEKLYSPIYVRKTFDNVEGKKYTEQQLKYYTLILDNLKPIYYETYEEWHIIGFILADISNKSSQMLTLWHNFSKKSKDKYDPEAADKIWEDAKFGYWSEDSLLSRLKKSSPEVYKSLMSSNSIEKIKAHTGSWTDDEIAEIIYDLGKSRFKMCSMRENSKHLYEFTNHIWKLRPNHVSLSEFIRLETKVVFKNALAVIDREKNLYLEKSDESLESNSKCDLLKAKSDKIYGVIKSLGSSVFKRRVMDETFNFFNDYDFLDKIDKQHYKFAFTNGVLDGTTGHFSDGNPEDYLTKQCPHPYYPYDPEAGYHKYFLEIDKFYNDLFIDDGVAHFVKCLDASSLFATINDARTFIGYGTGKNGKTKRTTLLNLGFGQDYYTEVSSGVFTMGRKKSGEADSERAKMNGARIIYTSEIGKGETITMHFLKEATGGGLITSGRELFKTAKSSTFQATGRIWWQTNHLPKIDCDLDVAVIRRLRMIHFKTQFILQDEYDEIKDESRKKYIRVADPQFDLKIKVLSEYLCSYLAHIYLTHVFEKPPVKEPKSILEATERYLSSINMLENFIKDCIEKGSIVDSITFDQAYLAFYNWRRTTLFVEKVEKNELCEFLAKRFDDTIDGRTIKGYKLK